MSRRRIGGRGVIRARGRYASLAALRRADASLWSKVGAPRVALLGALHVSSTDAGYRRASIPGARRELSTRSSRLALARNLKRTRGCKDAHRPFQRCPWRRSSLHCLVHSRSRSQAAVHRKKPMLHSARLKAASSAVPTLTTRRMRSCGWLPRGPGRGRSGPAPER